MIKKIIFIFLILFSVTSIVFGVFDRVFLIVGFLGLCASLLLYSILNISFNKDKT